MRILCLYQYYNTPDSPGNIRLFSLLQAIGKAHDVQVITSTYFRNKKKTTLFPEAPSGVEVSWLPVDFDNAMGKWSRIWSYGRFSWRAFWAGIKQNKKPDLIWGISTPLTVGMIALILSHFYKIPWVLEVRDLWPDFPIQIKGFRSKYTISFFKWVEKRLYLSAEAIVTTSPDMEKHVKAMLPEAEGNKVQTVIHGTNPVMSDAITQEQVRTLLQEYEIPDKFLVLYGGKFGRANDPPTILETIKRLAHEPDIHFVLSGFGFYEPEVMKAASQYTNLTYIPELPHHEMMVLNKTADLSLVTFLDLPVLAANSPAKFFDSLVAGVPVIVTNPGWTKETVEKEACGWFVPAERPDLLAEQILTLKKQPDALAIAGQNGAKLARKHYDRDKLGEDMKQILEKVLEEHRAV